MFSEQIGTMHEANGEGKKKTQPFRLIDVMALQDVMTKQSLILPVLPGGSQKNKRNGLLALSGGQVQACLYTSYAVLGLDLG